jgi:hypothetical protein
VSGLDRTENGTWCAECGTKGCDAVLRLRNLSFVTTGTSHCESCKAGGLLEDTEDGISVGSELGWCGCVDDDRVDQLMFEYLDRVERTNEAARKSNMSFAEAAMRRAMPSFANLLFADASPKKELTTDESQIQDDASMIMAHLASELGWTDHGSSIKYTWLTDGGKEALKVLRTWTETGKQTEADR